MYYLHYAGESPTTRAVQREEQEQLDVVIRSVTSQQAALETDPAAPSTLLQTTASPNRQRCRNSQYCQY